ncbi:hypothetical protein FOZ70_09275 [Burkholderia sp. COPS]|uniref:hypothetical protein n=1 Tax=unclassified Burkholderia TaxID=2613784 RepID=UPI001CA4DF7C|nr:hypothetical protein [Burkholderia sp. COPS]MBW5804936.1 hypothetical protein [Burkholderia sp. COPS]
MLNHAGTQQFVSNPISIHAFDLGDWGDENCSIDLSVIEATAFEARCVNEAHRSTELDSHIRAASTSDSAASDSGDQASTSEVALTVLTASAPVTKKFRLSPDGKLEKQTAAQVWSGNLSVRRLGNLSDFADLLIGLTPDQCVVYGVGPRDELRLTTKSSWYAAGCPEDSVPRTAEAFAWPSGRGILMLDYDAPKDDSTALTEDELIEAVHAVCPMLAESDVLWWPSTSSEIYNAETGEQLVGVKGQRLYFILDDASDIPRAGKSLLTHLWAAGHGRFEVSSGGFLLERGMFDASVWQTNRIDFAGGASCDSPLEQRRGIPVVLEKALRTVDSRRAVPEPSSDIVAAAERHKATARAAVTGLADRQRGEWVRSRTESISASRPSLTSRSVATIVNLAVDRRQLMGDWQIVVIDTNGGESFVTVDAILDNPEKYDNRLTLDPLEPEYDGRRAVGKIYCSGQPRIHSFAHGGATFKLCRNLVQIERVAGREVEAVDSLLRVMRESPEIFDFGTAVVKVNDGKAVSLNEASLRYWAAGVVQFFHKKTGADGQTYEVLEDPPLSICKTIMALGSERGLKPLRAIITSPTLREDGAVLAKPGYDRDSGLYLDIDEDDVFPVPFAPTETQARMALDTLWFPFKNFPFVDDLARTAHLAALVTAAVRASLPTAPAFGYDAPVQGSGKTLLAQCVAVLATGSEPVVYPHIAGNDDAEMRKRLFSALLAGQRAIVLDNILGTFDSAALASLLTSQMFQDRKLGKSETPSVPTNAMVLLTGNNMMLAGDMPRRVVPCRIDPQSETPFDRSFSVEPLRYCSVNRQKMVAATLTLIRYYLSAKVSRPALGEMGSFRKWDDFVRQTIVFINHTIAPGQFGDVMDLTKKNQAEDPQKESLRNLLLALHGCFGDRVFTANEVASTCLRATTYSESNDSRLNEAVIAVSTSPKISATSVGKVLSNRRNRLCDGLQLKVVSDNKNGRMWRVGG